MLRKFPRLFAKDYTDVQGVDAIQHKIELKLEIKPKAQKLRRLGIIKEQELLKEVQKLLATKFIYPVENFEWVSSVVVTLKKNGKWRVCVDYRPLNEATKRDHFPLPFQDEIINEVAGKEKYTVFDGYYGYFQIGIALEDQLKTTFITPWGCFVFTVDMPFGLTNAPTTFQCFMNMVFQEFFGKSVRVFIDDFGIYNSKALHPQKVEGGLKKLYDMGGQLNPDKCHIGEDEVILLGHKVAQVEEEAWTDRLLALAELEWKREAACESYKSRATQVKDKLNKKVKDKGIKEGDLVLRYDNRLNNCFDVKFNTRWQGPYIVKKAFNSSYYELMDLDGKEHSKKVNGYQLKPYLIRILPKDLQEYQSATLPWIIQKMVKNKTKLWDDFLDEALWPYQTMYKEPTDFTPIELNILTIRLHGKVAQGEEEAWTDRLLALEDLEWKREAACESYKSRATQVKDKLNKKVKDKEIKEGDLVLRYDNCLNNCFDVKFNTRWQGPYIVKKAFNSSYYELMDLDGKEHSKKVNGYQLKPYLIRILPKDLQEYQSATLPCYFDGVLVVSSNGVEHARL
ncbi:hypothetical protein L7F22_018798 [Adiantum nelumboides]|nr:hypothetical protein [Adiantum nelumboides]